MDTPEANIRAVRPAVETVTRMNSPDGELDLRGEVCPYTFVKAKLATEDMEPGSVLRILLDHLPAVEDVPRSLATQGDEVLAVRQLERYRLGDPGREGLMILSPHHRATIIAHARQAAPGRLAASWRASAAACGAPTACGTSPTTPRYQLPGRPRAAARRFQRR